MKFLRLIVFAFILFPLLLASQEKQGLLNKLLAPGPLMQGHSKLEKLDCLSCHDAGQGVPNSKCLDCHKEIKQSIERKKTFHGLSANKNCIECHTDHKGRDFDSTKINQKTFDHDLTGHVLHGKHKEIKCMECHKETRAKMAVRQTEPRYLGLITTCKSCHTKQDVHLYQEEYAKKDCNACHNEVKWKEVKDFDHYKISKFKLVGKHAEMSCARCHTPNGDKVGPSIYKWPKLAEQNCLSCHKQFHKDTLSEKYSDGKCERCHEQTSWKIPKFNHQITGFQLKGKHAEITCIKCHKTEDLKNIEYKLFQGLTLLPNHKYIGLKTTCISCHKDYHLFAQQVSTRFGKLENCQTCHTERSFKTGLNFNHNLDTRFKVDGKHTPLACIKCHTNSDPKDPQSERIYKWKDLEKDNCVICHASPHLKTFSPKNLEKRCSVCHVTSSWKETRKNDQFNHNIDTNFPLDGKHIPLSCKSCHGEGDNKVFKFENKEKQFCLSCHENVHKTQFSDKFVNKSCLECHTTESFKDVRKFDHNKTNFQLTGRHANPVVTCLDCHKATSEPLIYKEKTLKQKSNFKFPDDKKGLCESCHKNVHTNQFYPATQQKACTTCHTTTTFYDRKVFDHNMTAYPLIGFHEKTDCLKCHKSTGNLFSTVMPTNTANTKNPMHQFMFKNIQKDNCKVCHQDAHKGEYGNSCKDCHSETKKWKGTESFHKNFLLTGVHYTLKCNECHKDQRRLGGTSESCQLCHQKDDRHHGTLPNCKECHRQEFWEVTTFKHSRTGFPLRGMHRTLSCDSCHQNGMYQGKSSNCIDCHMKDKIRAYTTNPPHNIAGFETCNKCHNQFVFK